MKRFLAALVLLFAGVYLAEGQVSVSRGFGTIAGTLATYTRFVTAAGGDFTLISRAAIATAPTISSGFGTSPSVVVSNGTAAFTVNVGTGGVATAGVVALPAATTGWNCNVANRTALAAARTAQSTTAGLTYQTATTTTTVTVTNINVGSGAAVAWAASDVLAFSCTGY